MQLEGKKIKTKTRVMWDLSLEISYNKLFSLNRIYNLKLLLQRLSPFVVVL